MLLPSVIGGDLGCGTTALPLPVAAERLAVQLPRLEPLLREVIPVGAAHNSQVIARVLANPS